MRTAMHPMQCIARTTRAPATVTHPEFRSRLRTVVTSARRGRDRRERPVTKTGSRPEDRHDRYERAVVKAVGEDRHHDLGAQVGAVVSGKGNMKLTDQQASAVGSLAEQTVVAACALADAAGPESWSASAVEDAAAALEVLAGALAQLDPECAEILSVVPVAAAAVLERVEHARTGDGPQDDGRGAAGTSTALRQALTVHGITRHRVHQLGAALITVTLDPADAQALAMLLAQRGETPSEVRHADEGWGEGPAETAAAALAETLAAHGPSAYARVLADGQVSAGLTPSATRSVVTALGNRPSTGSRTGRRRGLGPGYKGLHTD
ncbi:hypothetical protein AB0K89_26310 [Streptomyces cinnamoneus]|uniref:hypothetical protein n=1 Tax=Streptomyces cinnamoneus TaxID=53446 RepID=UPI00342D940B